jgi:hypothetical protein
MSIVDLLNKKTMPALALVAVLLPLLSSMAISAQNKDSVQVPDGLAFSEFKGYEGWQVIAVSQTGDLLVAILGNPETIAAYQAGVPGNGQPFPDGAKMAKIHWNIKKARRRLLRRMCRTLCTTSISW